MWVVLLLLFEEGGKCTTFQWYYHCKAIHGGNMVNKKKLILLAWQSNEQKRCHLHKGVCGHNMCRRNEECGLNEKKMQSEWQKHGVNQKNAEWTRTCNAPTGLVIRDKFIIFVITMHKHWWPTCLFLQVYGWKTGVVYQQGWQYGLLRSKSSILFQHYTLHELFG